MAETVPAALPAGVYEDLITTALDAAISERQASGWHITTGHSDAALRAELLARHVYELSRRAFEAVPGKDDEKLARQLELANLLVEQLTNHGALANDAVADAARLLLEAQAPAPGKARPVNALRPTQSLRRSGWPSCCWASSRARGETMAYCCLGYARYLSHESERPMKIVWELEREMPGYLLS